MLEKLKDAWDDFLLRLPPYLKTSKRNTEEILRHQKLVDQLVGKSEDPPDFEGGWGW